jgi:hypothetical protein
MAERWLEDVRVAIPRNQHLIYVASASDGAPTFRGDYGWLALSYSSLDELEERAHSYWSRLRRPGNSA